MMNTVRSKRKEIMSFFGLDNYVFETHPNITGDVRLGERVFMPASLQHALIQNNSNARLELEFAVESDDNIWQPEIDIQIGRRIYRYVISNGSTITVHGSLGAGSKLSIGLINQPADHTHFWTGGDHNHYSCKQVLIKSMKLNGVDLLKLGHLDRHFKQTLLVTPPGEQHIKRLFAWPQESKHLWRLWTNMQISVDFDLPVLTKMCGWMLDANADQTPDWAIMDEFKNYLVDFHTELQYTSKNINP
jgi:hypothetical protein